MRAFHFFISSQLQQAECGWKKITVVMKRKNCGYTCLTSLVSGGVSGICVANMAYPPSIQHGTPKR